MTQDELAKLIENTKGHTPGPWQWNTDSWHGGWSGLFGANGEPVIYPQRENDGDDGDAWFASVEDAGEEGLSDDDKALIAAAPEMYAELTAIRAELAKYLDNPTGKVILDLRNVLAGAVGWKERYNNALDALDRTIFALSAAANICDGWAKESRVGGWSTHQMEANKRLANDLRRSASTARALLAARNKNKKEAGK